MCDNEPNIAAKGVMTIIDLTQPITHGMPVYPGDPQVGFKAGLELAKDGVNVARIKLGTHTGTHLDAPSHVLANGRTVDQLDLTLLHGNAFIVHLASEARANTEMRLADVHQLPVVLPPIVCIATGWDAHFHTGLRERHPHLGLDLVQELWERGARVLGIDTLSPDSTGCPADTMPVHEFWLGHDGVIVENLRGLTELPERVGMSLLPLPLTGLDGSPVRAVAWEL